MITNSLTIHIFIPLLQVRQTPSAAAHVTRCEGKHDRGDLLPQDHRQHPHREAAGGHVQVGGLLTSSSSRHELIVTLW